MSVKESAKGTAVKAAAKKVAVRHEDQPPTVPDEQVHAKCKAKIFASIQAVIRACNHARKEENSRLVHKSVSLKKMLTKKPEAAESYREQIAATQDQLEATKTIDCGPIAIAALTKKLANSPFHANHPNMSGAFEVLQQKASSSDATTSTIPAVQKSIAALRSHKMLAESVSEVLDQYRQILSKSDAQARKHAANDEQQQSNHDESSDIEDSGAVTSEQKADEELQEPRSPEGSDSASEDDDAFVPDPELEQKFLQALSANAAEYAFESDKDQNSDGSSSAGAPLSGYTTPESDSEEESNAATEPHADPEISTDAVEKIRLEQALQEIATLKEKVREFEALNGKSQQQQDMSSKKRRRERKDAAASTSKSKAVSKSKGGYMLPNGTGYVEGSDLSDGENSDSKTVKKERSNRRGSRARRAIWELKYGTNANHLKKEEEMRRAAKGGKHIPNPGKRVKGPLPSQDKAFRPPPPKPVPSEEDLRKKREKAEKEKARKEAPLHPSWEAKRKQKELMNAMASTSSAPAGKKIVFD